MLPSERQEDDVPTTHHTATALRTREKRVPAGLLAAYPTLRQAARMIGVHASSLSRRDLPVAHAGREARRLCAGVGLRQVEPVRREGMHTRLRRTPGSFRFSAAESCYPD